MTIVRVLIADRDNNARRKLRSLLETQSDFDVVGEADEGVLALTLARVLRPDLLLLDEHLPSLSSSAFATVLRTELPDTRLVILTEPAASDARDDFAVRHTRSLDAGSTHPRAASSRCPFPPHSARHRRS